uniref:Ig-like domain-containing protein n=1 Tax=Pseudonaja textilis TaxID=8673 RepID=A0A670YPN1_PSETE
MDPAAYTNIIQMQSMMLEEGQDVRLVCIQDYGHRNMLWFRQHKQQQDLQLLYNFYNGNIVQKIQSFHRLNADQPTLDRSLWDILVMLFNTVSNTLLYFGQGTRLTVLERGHIITPPTVTIFSPSKRELEKKRKVTIVCLATDFYPDHVILTWSLNNKDIIEGIKTEEPKYENKKYSLISRLRITGNQWQNSENNFKCKVDFYNSSERRLSSTFWGFSELC